MAYRILGKAFPRIEGYGKVTGQTKYAADLEFPGLAWAKVLRSPLPHARIVRIDVSRAKTLTGVDGGAGVAPVNPRLTADR